MKPYKVECSPDQYHLIFFFFQIRRVDLIEDLGDSMSPYVDIGQVEGAFMMGLGYWLHEKLVYDQNTGQLLTDRTWVGLYDYSLL